MRLALAAVVFAVLSAPAVADSPRSMPRLTSSDLVYRGAFLLPAQVSDRKTFAYGGTALAYNPAHHSLFGVGHDWYQLTAEVSIPRPVRSSRLRDLNRGRYRQGFADATNGAIDETGGTDNKIGGQLVHRGRLYGSAYVYYDAGGSQIVSHWARRSTSLAGARARGLYRVGKLGAGMVSGYMAEVPRAWRGPLGGPALTGNCCIPIISRTSFGPAAFAFDPAGLGRSPGARPTPLVYYPQEHPTLGAWDATWNPGKGVLFNGGTTIRGLAFPRGTRSVLFFGTQGTGRFCYGEGTDQPSRAGTPTGDGTTWCYDPEDSSKGTHAYPYVPQVWAYDAAHLRSVRKRRKQPWQVRPYATWTLDLPFGSSRIGGAAYDPRAGLIYVSQQYGEGTAPVIHVFEVSLARSSARAAAAPSEIWVKPGKGSDRASGTRSKPLRTLNTAWRRAGDGTTIHLLAGRVGVGGSPNYWEEKAGIRLVGHGKRGAVSLPALNMFRLTRVTLKNLTVRGDVHCERCSRWTLDRVVIRARGAQEGLKVNQSDHVKVVRSDISNATDNSLDFVAVQYATIAHNKIHRAQDWCAYAKGGSAYIRVFDNEFYDCGTGGFTAGQGTGLQFMTAPWFQYEAYDVRVYDNRIHDTEGAGLGVNGGYNILFAGNSLRRVGSRSHAVEVVFGSRSCDGQPGDDGRARCGEYIEQGAWGTTVVDDGTNYIRIPNRHIFIFNNSVLKAGGADDYSIAGPYNSPAQRASKAPAPALADDDLRRGGNNFSGGAAGGVPVPDFDSWEVPVPDPPTLSNQDLGDG